MAPSTLLEASANTAQTGLEVAGAVDPISNDVLVGGTNFGFGTITCGNVSLMLAFDIFVSRLAASNGSVIFATSFGADDAPDELFDIAVDEQGSILFTGHGANLSFGGPPLTGGYVAKLASNGSHVWTKGFGAGWGFALAVDAAGGLAISGYGSDTGPLNFGGGDLNPLGKEDLFVARLDGLGNHGWSRRFGSPGDNRSTGLDVAIDSKGNRAVTGRVYGNVVVDETILAGNSRDFVTTFDADGKTAWSKAFGYGGCNVAFSPQDELVVACQSTKAADFGKGLATPVGNSDMFLLKIAP